MWDKCNKFYHNGKKYNLRRWQEENTINKEYSVGLHSYRSIRPSHTLQQRLQWSALIQAISMSRPTYRKLRSVHDTRIHWPFLFYNDNANYKIIRYYVFVIHIYVMITWYMV